MSKEMLIDYSIKALGLIFIVMGWGVTYFLTKKKDQDIEKTRRKQSLEFEKLKWKKDYIDKKLAEFYGPIYGLLLETQRVREHIDKQLGREIIFEESNPLTENEKRIWVHFVENYSLPNYLKIVEIIRQKSHLINNAVFPKEFLLFVDYTVGWNLLHKQYKELGIEYGFYYPTGFPKDFSMHIMNSVDELMKEQLLIIDELSFFNENTNNNENQSSIEDSIESKLKTMRWVDDKYTRERGSVRVSVSNFHDDKNTSSKDLP